MISLLVPSRGRPSSIARLWESARSTAAGDIEMIVRLDDDDPCLDAYAAPGDPTWIIGPRVTLSSMWNECWLEARGEAFGLIGDDVIFRSQGWDSAVAAAFPPDGIAYVHGDDLGGRGAELGTHGFVRREWTEAVGMFAPPHFASDYTDLWLNEVAEALGRRVFLPGVVMEHMHPGFGKAEWDLTHQQRMARHRAENVEHIWEQTADERWAWVEQLRDAIVDAGGRSDVDFCTNPAERCMIPNCVAHG